MRNLLLILLSVGPLLVLAQASYNFDFEEQDQQTRKSKNWFWGMGSSKNYRFSLDSTGTYSGKYSTRIDNTVDDEKVFGAFGTSIPAAFAGKKIKLQSYIKTKNVDGWAGLWMRIDGTSEFKNMKDHGLKGTHDWKAYSIELDLKEGAQDIVLGGLLSGRGIVWFDKLSVTIDGIDIAVAPKEDLTKFNPKPGEIEWLKNHTVPLKSVNAGNGFADLQPLKSFVGDARIVSLGECTHGTSEVFKIKHRLLEFLATEMDFRIFSIEANMGETQAINQYVLDGWGDPKRLLDTMYFWTWNTQEVLDMMVWMRSYNIKNPTKKLQFTGFDMQSGKGSADILSLFTKKYAPDMALLTDSIASQVIRIQKRRLVAVGPTVFSVLEKNLETLAQYLEQHKTNIIEKTGKREYEWLAHNITLLHQFRQLAEAKSNYNIRDKSMAENVEWLLKQNPGQKIVLWAHNGHVNRQQNLMGGFLTDNGHREDMRIIGFSAGRGTYTAVKPGQGVYSNNVLAEPIAKTFEKHAMAVGWEQFFIDIRKQNLNDKNADWLNKKIGLRNIGALEMTGSSQFTWAVLPDLYDAIIYIDQTNASKCFKAK